MFARQDQSKWQIARQAAGTVCVWAVVGMLAARVVAQAVDAESKSPAPSVKKEARQPISAEREKDIMRFVDQHHSKLRSVLMHLKRKLPREYSRAIRDLDRTMNRLDQIRDPERRELELHHWKARSRVQLLGAQVQMGNQPRLVGQLREAMAAEYDVRRQILERDRQRLSERLMKVTDQIQELEQNRSQAIEKQLNSLMKKKSSKSDKSAKANAAAKRNKKTAPSRTKARTGGEPRVPSKEKETPRKNKSVS